MAQGKLTRISDLMAAQVEAGEITGAITAIALKGEVVHFDTHGWRDVEDRVAMPADAIFRMASSTKPVVGVAVMQQIEQGRVSPDDPVAKFIPEFRDTKVAVKKRGGTSRPAEASTAPAPPAGDDPSSDAAPGGVSLGAGAGVFRNRSGAPPEVELVPAQRDILVRDLLTHTSGLLSGGLGSAVSEVRRERGDTLASFIPRLGGVPLDFQPGTRWQYSPGTGIDVLGHIVELVSGQPLDEYLQEHIFEPVGMTDTFFALPDDRRARLLPLYRQTEDGFVRADPAMANRMASTTYFSGSGGLMSTASDYLRFERMLTGLGTLDGRQVLRPETVELMATNHVGDLFGGLREPVQGVGFGFTVQVVLDAEKARSARSTGAFGWGGAFGTMTWSDPARQLAGVYMVQQPNLRVRARFERVARAAVDELEGVGN
jgi:CubicO group peptidase (beta-lactamase class C family)